MSIKPYRTLMHFSIDVSKVYELSCLQKKAILVDK